MGVFVILVEFLGCGFLGIGFGVKRVLVLLRLGFIGLFDPRTDELAVSS